MTRKKLNRGALAGANRGSELSVVATWQSEHNLSPFHLQEQFLRRRGVSPLRAAIVAAHAFGEARS